MAVNFSCMLSTNPKFPLFSPTGENKQQLRPSSPPKSFKTTISDRRAYWASVEADIDANLLNSLPATPPPVVTNPLRHLISAAPKTIAPALCVAACELVGGHRNAAMCAASALRLMHAGEHAHARPRRGPAAYSAGVELLTGDAILPLGYEVAARSGCEPARVLRVIVEIADAMGPRWMVEGEGKEGRMAACGAACGGIVGGGSGEAVERLRRLGMYVGMMGGCLEGRVEVAEELRSMARLELDGFEEEEEEERAEGLRVLVDLWYEELMMRMMHDGEKSGCA